MLYYLLPPLTPCRSVVTIHDCIHLRFPQYLPNRIGYAYARASLWIAAGRTRSAALGAAAALGIATLAGVVLTDLSTTLEHWGLALSAGVTLYVGASNLIPEFQGKAGWGHNVAFFGGCGIAVGLRALIGH